MQCKCVVVCQSALLCCHCHPCLENAVSDLSQHKIPSICPQKTCSRQILDPKHGKRLAHALPCSQACKEGFSGNTCDIRRGVKSMGRKVDSVQVRRIYSLSECGAWKFLAVWRKPLIQLSACFAHCIHTSTAFSWRAYRLFLHQDSLPKCKFLCRGDSDCWQAKYFAMYVSKLGLSRMSMSSEAPRALLAAMLPPQSRHFDTSN